MKTISAIIVLTILTFFSKNVFGQTRVNCNNISLSNDTFFVSPSQNQISTVLYYKDTTAMIYFVSRLILFDTFIINSKDINVGSILKFPGSNTYKPNFKIDFKSNVFNNGSIISGFIHIFDSDYPKDSIATCYLPVKLVLQNTVGMQFEKFENLQIFPNPIKEFLTLQFKNESIKSIKINSIEGVEILNKNVNSHIASIDMIGVAKGVYFLTVITSSGQTTKKIIKY